MKKVISEKEVNGFLEVLCENSPGHNSFGKYPIPKSKKPKKELA